MATLAQERGLAVRRRLGPPGASQDLPCGWAAMWTRDTLTAETRRRGGSWRGPGCSERGQGARCPAAAERGGPGARSGARLSSSEPASRSPALLGACWGQGGGGGLRAAPKAALWEAEEPRELQEPPLVAVGPRCSSWAARRNLGNKPAPGPGRSEAAGAGALGAGGGGSKLCRASAPPRPLSVELRAGGPAALPRFPKEPPRTPPCLRASGEGRPGQPRGGSPELR